MVLRSNVPFMGTRWRTAELSWPWGRGTPFCCCAWTAPLCWEGTIAEGACRALMAEVADELGPADVGCGRVVDSPEIGSTLVAGHSPFGAFVLRAAQADASVPVAGATPFGCEEEADMVEVVEACDDNDEDELVRWALLRGINTAPPPLGTPSALHACRLMFWKLTGGATAVIGEEVNGTGREVDSTSPSLFPGVPSSRLSAARRQLAAPNAMSNGGSSPQRRHTLMRRDERRALGSAAV